MRSTNYTTFVTVGMILLSLATLSFAPGTVAAGHSVTRVSFNPTTPNVLTHGHKVTLNFSYATTQPGGVRIFARPFTGGSPTPGYAASPGPLSPTGSGTGSQYFTINTGNVTVNQVRIQMWNATQTTLLFEAFLPVNFEYRAP